MSIENWKILCMEIFPVISLHKISSDKKKLNKMYISKRKLLVY